jgi:ribosomal protein L12E/L44/L45/RPP1/RPP2
MIQENRARLEQVVERLLEAETMDGRDVEELVKQGRISTEAERAAAKQAATGAPPADPAAVPPPPAGEPPPPPPPPPPQEPPPQP